jgi:hypothetical protein
MFAREAAKDLNKTHVAIKLCFLQRASATDKALLRLLQTLWEDGKDLALFGLPMIVDELERLLRAEPRARELISGYVAGRIGDLSILCECLRQLDIYQPWAMEYEHPSITWGARLKDDLVAWSDGWAGIRRALESKAMLVNFKLAHPSDKRFFYPAEKRRSKETVDALRQAEANLDAFWDRFDGCLHAKAAGLSETALGRLLSQQRTLQRTPEWTAPPAEAKTPNPAADSPEGDALSRPVSTPHFEPGQPQDKQDAPADAAAKTKVKTRGAASTEATQRQEQATDAVATLRIDEQPLFHVDARALKVFRTLFFYPSVTSAPGEVSWNDLLHAMTSTGFRAEKLYGSVWHFQPSQRHLGRSIQFHEPHPVAKIPFRVARGMGRRLARAYGWDGGMFVLRE